MASHYYAMLSRMKYIYRWGLMRNTRNENLSEHSLETAFIAHALAVISNRRLGGNVNPERVALVAMFHDTTEIITGDLPTPVKYYNPQIKDAYKLIETAAQEKLLNMLPADLIEDYSDIYNVSEPKINAIVKAADKISALIKCAEEKAQGNHEFTIAYDTTLQTVRDLKLPEADIFLEEFLPSFGLTLDEQK